MGHDSFAIAKDMTWFSVDVMAVLNYFNDKCSSSTMKSAFDMGNLRCMEMIGFDGFLQ